MNAVIMAGGQGTRLMPLTANMPKPMASIAGKPCIIRTLEHLRRYGINDAAVTVAYKKEQIKQALVAEHVRFYEEERPLGTAGSVKKCADFVDDNFIVISGDAVCDFDLSAIIAAHMSHHDPVTIVLTESDDPLEYGVCVLDDNGVITRFIEKPSWECVYSNLVNTGIYVLSRSVLDYVPADKPFDFSKDLFPLLMAKGITIHGYKADGYWCDIGNIREYMRCNRDVLCGAADIEFSSEPCPGADVRPPCVIGKNVRAEGAVIGPYAVIGDGCVIGEGCVVEGSILGRNCEIADSGRVQNALLCDNVKCGPGVKVYDYAVISDNCTVGRDATVSCESLVYPDSFIEAGAMIKQHVMRGVRKTLFERGRIHRPENVSEYSQWGYAFGSNFEGNIGVAAEDGRCLAESLGIMCGVMGSGRGVMNMGECDMNAFRYTIKAYGFGGGIFVTGEHLWFFEEDGLPLSRFSERKVLRAFYEPQPFDGGAGRYRILNHYMNVYVHKLKRYLLNTPVIKFQVVAPAFLTELMNIRSADGEEKIYINDSLSVAGYTDEQVKCAVCHAYGSTYGKVYIPYDFPHIAESIGKAGGFEVIRLAYDDPDRRYLYDMTDVSVMGCVLLRYLSKKKMTFAELAAKLPDIYVSRAEVDADRCTVMRRLSSELNDCNDLSEGVSFRDDVNKNYVTVVPKRDSNGFRLVAESLNSETAGELCDFYVRKIRSINSEVDKKEIF